MICKRLRLNNFRNYADQEIKFSSGLNILLGKNGSGKTNVLEAIHLITQGNSFRYSDNSKLIKNNSTEAYIEADFENQDLDYITRLLITKSKKQFSLNLKKTSVVEFKKLFPTVLFSPESLSSIKEGSDLRRQLLDELIVFLNKNNADLLLRFKKVYKVRNRILKNHIINNSPINETLALLDSVNPSFLKLAIKLVLERIKAIKAIQTELNSAMQFISNDFQKDLQISYLISGHNAEGYNEEKIQQLIYERAEELVKAELSTGATLIGPTKHDVQFIYTGKDSRFFCSQGQQRAIILAFKMAQIVYHRRVHGFYPILMLDDVFSELDEVKRNALTGFLHEIKTQIFMTTTELSLSLELSQLDLNIFDVDNGKIKNR